jgi:DNA phosphorothioation-dependent restriction protein DptG
MKDLYTTLENDAAFIYSIQNNDVSNLQMVLRAHGYQYDYEFAESVLHGSAEQVAELVEEQTMQSITDSNRKATLDYSNAMFEVLETDAAYIWSIENNDVHNMQLVLRAYKFPYSAEFAEMVLNGTGEAINNYLKGL